MVPAGSVGRNHRHAVERRACGTGRTRQIRHHRPGSALTQRHRALYRRSARTAVRPSGLHTAVDAEEAGPCQCPGDGMLFRAGIAGWGRSHQHQNQAWGQHPRCPLPDGLSKVIIKAERMSRNAMVVRGPGGIIRRPLGTPVHLMSVSTQKALPRAAQILLAPARLPGVSAPPGCCGKATALHHHVAYYSNSSV